jgi:hypothetical protein
MDKYRYCKRLSDYTEDLVDPKQNYFGSYQMQKLCICISTGKATESRSLTPEEIPQPAFQSNGGKADGRL